MLDPLPPSAPDRADLDAAEVDARLVRSVRRRLVLWSGGTTLLVLLVLAAALYLSVASTLETAGVAVLDGRASDIVAAIRHEREAAEGPHTDFAFGGGGTFAIVIAHDGTTIGPPQFQMPSGLPDTDAAAAATAKGRDVRLRMVTFGAPTAGAPGVVVPVRQLTVPTDTSQGHFVVQVLQDRTAEARTLASLLGVLLVGGLVVVLVAFGFGTIYARRALAVVLVFHYVCLAWIFFRASSFDGALAVLRQIALLETDHANLVPVVATALAVGFACHLWADGSFGWLQRRFVALPAPAQGTGLAAVALVLIKLGQHDILPFIYFQF